MAIPAIQESWGLEDDATVAEFSTQVYAAKFNSVSGSPGYVEDIFTLRGDLFTQDAPFVLH
jgi:hypothetical protein